MPPKIGTGDDGSTSLFSGKRVPKNDERIEAVGTIDELQSVFGLVLAEDLEKETAEVLNALPHMLFDISAEIAGEGKFVAENVTEAEVKKMTKWIQKLDVKMPELRAFILASSVRSSQLLNLARAITRRAERRMASLLQSDILRPELFHFFNRLSRLLFTLERWESFRKGGEEKEWEKGQSITKDE